MDGKTTRDVPALLTPSANRSAEILRLQRPRILELFIERIQRFVPAASTTAEPILMNTFPELLSSLSDALAPEHPRTLATDGTTIAEEHGGERVRLTNYRTDDVIREFQILRDVIFDVLKEEAGPIPEQDRQTIVRSFDSATLSSCTAFHLADQKIRQQFLIALTHDLRGPLTAAKAGASLIVRKPDSPEAPRWAARVVESIERADKMVRDLLDASRVGSEARLQLTYEEGEMVAVINDVLEQQRTIHGDRFQITSPASVIGHWSLDAIRRAVENLVTNAVKYGDAQHPVTVVVEDFGARVIVKVHNQGSYIPPDERETLFQAFRRTRSAEKSGTQGWGVGLALVRGVAEAHGGSIAIDSLADSGTTFIFDIPRDARPFQNAPTSG